MNKTKKIFISLIVIYTICATFITSFAENTTNPDGKGTVSGSGTQDDPYQLVMGEPLIDIYYGDYAEAIKNGIYFEFVGGNYNAANYIVENNVDKGRLRFKLQGTEEPYLRVTPQQRLSYLQAGGVYYLPDYLQKEDDDDDESNNSGDVTIPYYSIMAIEDITATRYVAGVLDYGDEIIRNEQVLANGYLIAGNTVLNNIATYGQSYVFAKSNSNYDDLYKLGNEQIEKLGKFYINFIGIGQAYFNHKGDYSKITSREVHYDTEGDEIEPDIYYLHGPVKVVYKFEGTNSQIHDSEGEDASPIEDLLSRFGMFLIDKFVTISKIGGTDGKDYVTIDSLVFNEYPNTIVDFWGDTNYFSGKSKPMIDFWFNVFKAWAIVAYIILLIYIGIKTMLVSGTSEQKKVKSMLEGWLVGILMLFCFPFLFKYLIEINDMVVDILRTNSKYSVYAYYTFENMYTIWGKEDGEDSTTDVIASLRRAEEQLKQQIEDIDSNVNSIDEKIEGYRTQIENNKGLMEATGEAIKNIIDMQNIGIGRSACRKRNFCI